MLGLQGHFTVCVTAGCMMASQRTILKSLPADVTAEEALRTHPRLRHTSLLFVSQTDSPACTRLPPGVWSGCAFPSPEGVVILNTATRLRATTPLDQLPPTHLDLGLQMIESQAFAVAVPGRPELGSQLHLLSLVLVGLGRLQDARAPLLFLLFFPPLLLSPHPASGDPLLRTFIKGTAPLIQHPPCGGLTGWRDPFLCGRPGDGEHERCAIRNRGGAPAGCGGLGRGRGNGDHEWWMHARVLRKSGARCVGRGRGVHEYVLALRGATGVATRGT